MRLWAGWAVTGIVVGAVAGASFGGLYMLAGAGLGLAAGMGIAAGLRGNGRRA